MKKVERDYRKLRGRIIEKFGTIAEFSDHVTKTYVTVSLILNNKGELDQSDIEEWATALEINIEDIPEYFFAH